ncbi:hypothetical protein [Streptacidiphilus jiangxiensis]|uniref:Uncharacterized protein n=1 Tax=Streptacidiphilus jiangxiensis TaxID=235985 RepID=A0A1H7L7P2_STRJI|nr:hypothetical protein [Streptacidiphilus jiangxiensis]SEK95053.1 hypothetical protein SAMN05414137_104383 [Streptacidiphilus jiangxiensis]
MTPLQSIRQILLAATLALAALPAATAAARPADTADPAHCTPPAHVGEGRALDLALDLAVDWPDVAVPPGTAQALGVHVTNTGSLPTDRATTVVVHGFQPNTYTADPGPALTPLPAGGVSFAIPAGVSPGETVSRTVTVELGASVPPHATERCAVTAADGPDGADRATAVYDVVTGAPVVHVVATVLPARGKPGETVPLVAVLGNAGPSNEYTGPAVFTFRAPTRTHWARPSAYRCTPDASATVLTCRYPGAPLTWRDEAEELPLTIAPSARPGTRLNGGTVTATDPFDPVVFHGAGFGVDVTS